LLDLPSVLGLAGKLAQCVTIRNRASLMPLFPTLRLLCTGGVSDQAVAFNQRRALTAALIA
jgi:hypothetical protein